jgi:hypothetical protein
MFMMLHKESKVLYADWWEDFGFFVFDNSLSDSNG